MLLASENDGKRPEVAMATSRMILRMFLGKIAKARRSRDAGQPASRGPTCDAGWRFGMRSVSEWSRSNCADLRDDLVHGGPRLVN